MALGLQCLLHFCVATLSKFKLRGSSQPPLPCWGRRADVGGIEAQLYGTQEPPRSGLNTL